MGYPLADHIVGILITVAILRIVRESGKAVFICLLDGVAPKVIDEIRRVVSHTPGVKDITEVRVRWLGHWLHAELNIAVNPELSIEKRHEIGKEVRHHILHHLRYLSDTMIHIDPLNTSGEEYHSMAEHRHDDLPSHSHSTGICVSRIRSGKRIFIEIPPFFDHPFFKGCSIRSMQ